LDCMIASPFFCCWWWWWWCCCCCFASQQRQPANAFEALVELFLLNKVLSIVSIFPPVFPTTLILKTQNVLCVLCVCYFDVKCRWQTKFVDQNEMRNSFLNLLTDPLIIRGRWRGTQSVLGVKCCWTLVIEVLGGAWWRTKVRPNQVLAIFD
jgi:hypothetical protein